MKTVLNTDDQPWRMRRLQMKGRPAMFLSTRISDTGEIELATIQLTDGREAVLVSDPGHTSPVIRGKEIS